MTTQFTLNQGSGQVSLRWYQKDAAIAALESMAAGKNPVISLPTASGKSFVIAALCSTLPGRTLVLSHRKELLEQDQKALFEYNHLTDSGIYCAGLNRRDADNRVVFGGVASVYRRLDELQREGSFTTIIVDEAHLVNRQGEGLMYDSCLQTLSIAKVVGLTATPYRNGSGLLHSGPGAWFNDLAIHIPPTRLVDDGFLSPLVGIGARNTLDVDGVHVRQGDFVASELHQAANREGLIERTVTEMIARAEGRQHVLVFCININHARQVHAELIKQGERVSIVTSKPDSDELDRDEAISAFKDGTVRWLVNVEILTTGTNIPFIDCIAILCPTLSKIKHIQILGRGMRLSEGKEDCLILDFAGNVLRHGAVDTLASFQQVKTAKEEEKEKRERNQTARKAREIQFKHSERVIDADPMLGADTAELEVIKMQYRLVPAKKFDGKHNIIVDYCCEGMTIRQWLCVEYPGGARWHAEQWFKRRGIESIPRNAEACIAIARKSMSPESISIYHEIYQGNRTPRVAIEHFKEEDDNAEFMLKDVA